MSSGNACEGKTTTTNQWGPAGSMSSLRSCVPFIGSLYVSWIVGGMEGMIRGRGGGAVKWSLGRGAPGSEACKHWPCLRQKSFILLPCIRQETSFNNPDSFHFLALSWLILATNFWQGHFQCSKNFWRGITNHASRIPAWLEVLARSSWLESGLSI